MLELKRAIGIYDLFQVGRIRVSWCRFPVWSWSLNRYEAYGQWVSWQFGWVRIYLLDAQSSS